MIKKVQKTRKNIENCFEKLNPIFNKVNKKLKIEYKEELLEIFKKIRFEDNDKIDNRRNYIKSTIVESLINYKKKYSIEILKEQIYSVLEDKKNYKTWLSFVFIFYLLNIDNKKKKSLELNLPFQIYFKDSVLNLCNSLLFNSDFSIFQNKYYKIEFINKKKSEKQNEIKELKKEIEKTNFGSDIKLKNFILNILAHEIFKNIKSIYNLNKKNKKIKNISIDEKKDILIEEKKLTDTLLNLVIFFNRTPYFLDQKIMIFFKNIELCGFHNSVVDNLIDAIFVS